jgi:hypothetical protein
VCLCVFYFWVVLFCFLQYWVLNLDLSALPLEPCPQLTFFFAFSYFSDKVSCFCPGSASKHDPLTYASHVARVTGVHHTLVHFFVFGGVWLLCWLVFGFLR